LGLASEAFCRYSIEHHISPFCSLFKYSMIKKRYFTLILLASSLSVSAEEYLSLLSLGFSQTSSDYFADGQSTITPNNYSFGLVKQVSDDWIIGFDYSKQKGNGRWLNEDDLQVELFNEAEIESKNMAINAIWLADFFELSFGTSVGDSRDISRSVLPVIDELVDIEDRTFDIAIGKTWELGEDGNGNFWEFDFDIGLQYAEVDISISDRVNTEPPLFIDNQIEQTNTSVIFDFSVSYQVEKNTFIWSPYLSASWNAELSSDGDQVVLVSRGDGFRTSDQLTERFATSFRIPDSGTWSIGTSISWDSGWGGDLSYSRSVSTNYDLDRISLSINLVF